MRLALKPMPSTKKAPAKKTAPLSPAERMKKMQEARKAAAAAGGGAKKPAVKKAKLTPLTPEQKKALLVHEAPADMKPCFIEVRFKTAKDGLLSTAFSAQRVRGRWDNPDAKRFDMMEYDAKTVVAMMQRLFAATWAANPQSRLPGGRTFKVILRVSVKKADNSILSRVVAAGVVVKKAGSTKPSLKWYEDKADPVYRKLRRASNNLRGAFTDLQLPPSGRQKKSDE